MASRVKVKICGLTEIEGVAAAVEAGADFLGMVFFPPSPRNLPLESAAVTVELSLVTTRVTGPFTAYLFALSAALIEARAPVIGW